MSKISLLSEIYKSNNNYNNDKKAATMQNKEIP